MAQIDSKTIRNIDIHNLETCQIMDVYELKSQENNQALIAEVMFVMQSLPSPNNINVLSCANSGFGIPA